MKKVTFHNLMNNALLSAQRLLSNIKVMTSLPSNEIFKHVAKQRKSGILVLLQLLSSRPLDNACFIVLFTVH